MSFLTRIREAFTVPYGPEDQHGTPRFDGAHSHCPDCNLWLSGNETCPHVGQDHLRNLTEQARILSLRASTPACRNSAAVAGVVLFPSVHSSELPRGH